MRALNRSIQIWALLALALVLAACEITGGVPRTTTPVPPEPLAAEPTAPAAVAVSPAPAASVIEAEPTASPAPTAPPVLAEGLVRIGLPTDPGDLLPYHTDPVDERVTAPVSELLFPAPLLAVGYAYTTTGVLERVPSLENGDVTIATVDVFLDQTGAITTTATQTISQVQQISVTFRWNPALRWSDGMPVTADDSVFAYDLARRVYLGQEARSKLDLLERYEKIDEQTTLAVLKPDFIDPGYLTTFFTPLPKHLLESQDPAGLATSEYALLPVGYGPYLVERRDQGTLRLARNPHAPGPAGEFEQVDFIFRDDLALLRSSVGGGSLDVAAMDQPLPEELAAIRAAGDAGAFTVSAVASPIWEHLDFNLDLPILQEIRVRRAIGHAINREAMAAELLGGYGSVLESWIVPGQWAVAPLDQITRYPYNPDEARRLLDEAGVVDTNGDGLRETGGEPLTLSLVTTQGSPLRLAMAQRIRDDLLAVGIGLSLQEVPTAALYSADGPLFRRGFQLALFAWIAGPDPRGWERWSCAGVPSASNSWAGNNFPGWCFFEADRAIRTATTSLVPEERAAAYLRQQQLFTQELPVLPLFQRVDLVLVSPTLEGVSADPTAPFTWNLTSWSRK